MPSPSSIADDFAKSLRDLLPVELFSYLPPPPSGLKQQQSTDTATASTSTASTATAATSGGHSKLPRAPSKQNLNRAAAVKHGHVRNRNRGNEKEKLSPPSTPYFEEIHMKRVPSGFGNESYEIKFGTVASRLKSQGAAVAISPLSTSVATSPTSSLKSSVSSSSSTVIHDDDLASMPNSPWSSIRKRVGVTVPRQERPLNLASISSMLAFVIALGWVVTVFAYSCW